MQRVAVANGIDPYSYEYEILETTLPVFSDPEGLATRFFRDGRFDLDRLRREYAELRILSILGAIARESLGGDDIQPALMDTLRKAYDAGRADRE